jgi:methionyl-tRNA formyltransferase
MLRAFGRFECLAEVNKVLFHAPRRGLGEPHRFPPGAVVHSDGPRLVLACSDGYVALLEWSLLAPGTPTDTLLR